MRTIAFATAAAAAALATAAPASAATTINLVPIAGTLTGAFGNANPARSGTDLYNFTVPTSGDLYGFVGSLGLKITLTNLDFTSVTLDGISFDKISSGIFELQTIAQSIGAGSHTLSIGYKNAQLFSSYGGVISFTPIAAGVPEPATWGLMILGFGAVAGAMRYKRRGQARIRFA